MVKTIPTTVLRPVSMKEEGSFLNYNTEGKLEAG